MYHDAHMLSIEPLLAQHPVVPVVTIADLRDAVPLASALADGGIHILEITLRSDAATEAIAAIRTALPETIVGAGTVKSKALLDAAMASGAQFAVAPGMTPALLDAAIACGLPFLPAASTASEIMTLLDAGFTAIKFFPAAAMGGTSALAALAGPLPEARFCPSGGVTGDNFMQYLQLKNVVSASGSWLAPSHVVKEKNWRAVTAQARRTLDMIA